MASGIKLSDDALEQYNQLQLPKEVRYRYLIFHIKEGKEIVVEESKKLSIQDNLDPTEADFNDFRQKMKTKSSRYAVYDVGKKPVLIMWNPQSASIREKMVYASSFDGLKKKFSGIGAVIQADDIGEIVLEEIMSKGNSQKSCKK